MNTITLILSVCMKLKLARNAAL